MENDIRHHKYLEYGEHKGHIYGTTLDSIREVINEGKMCVLDCSPAVSCRHRILSQLSNKVSKSC